VARPDADDTEDLADPDLSANQQGVQDPTDLLEANETAVVDVTDNGANLVGVGRQQEPGALPLPLLEGKDIPQGVYLHTVCILGKSVLEKPDYFSLVP